MRRVSAATEKRHADQRARLAERGIDLHEKPRSSRSKYHNVTAYYKGQRYDSAGEAEYARMLDLGCAAGSITDWERPKPFVLLDAPKPRDRVTYKPDFYVIPKAGMSYYVDYKGSAMTETASWRIKVKLWKQKIPFELRVAYPNGEEKVVCTGDEAIAARLA
jgi:uncharacterized protein DUF1064